MACRKISYVYKIFVGPASYWFDLKALAAEKAEMISAYDLPLQARDKAAALRKSRASTAARFSSARSQIILWCSVFCHRLPKSGH